MIDLNETLTDKTPTESVEFMLDKAKRIIEAWESSKAISRNDAMDLALTFVQFANTLKKSNNLPSCWARSPHVT
jgi:hypothetical protein